MRSGNTRLQPTAGVISSTPRPLETPLAETISAMIATLSMRNARCACTFSAGTRSIIGGSNSSVGSA